MASGDIVLALTGLAPEQVEARRVAWESPTGSGSYATEQVTSFATATWPVPTLTAQRVVVTDVLNASPSGGSGVAIRPPIALDPAKKYNVTITEA